MAIERRGFLKVIGGFALAGVLLRPREWTFPSRCIEAVRINIYPGPRKRLTPADIAKPGHWAG